MLLGECERLSNEIDAGDLKGGFFLLVVEDPFKVLGFEWENVNQNMVVVQCGKDEYDLDVY
jgi:hypothetical protein